MNSLFDRVGGSDAITKASLEFYDRVMADETLAPFFDDVDIDTQATKMIGFMTMAFGGPHGYSGQDLRTAHAKLIGQGLDDHHFDAVLAHLRQTLGDLGVAPDLIDEAMGVVGSTRGDVLSR